MIKESETVSGEGAEMEQKKKEAIIYGKQKALPDLARAHRDLPGI